MKAAPARFQINRRRFIALTGTAVAAPAVLTGCSKEPARQPAPSNRITLGIVGWGWQGPGNTKQFLAQNDCQVVAACDLDRNHLDNAVKTINQQYGNKDCNAYHDYRELMARGDIDAVMLAVPDHWHRLVAVEAANRKKHIYGEKPLARTIAEQQAIVKTVEAGHDVWQTGSWQRSTPNFHKAAEIVRNGMIGRVTRVEVGLFAGNRDLFNKSERASDTVNLTPAKPPPELDYDMWIGPSKLMPYIEGRVHRHWRWNYNTGGGQLMDWVGHHVDIAHWGLDFDNSGPSEIEGHGDFPPADAVWNTCTRYRIELKYPGDIQMIIAAGHLDINQGIKWIGTDGWVYVDREKFDSSNPDWKDFKQLPEEMRKVKLYLSSNHQRNFLDCIKSRQPTISPVQTAHHSTIPGHLGLISMLVGRKLKWDVAGEQILNDPGATKLLTRPYRPPWDKA